MVKKQYFYYGEKVYRKNQIIKWFLEDDNRNETISNLTTFIEEGNIYPFERQLDFHIEPAFTYISFEGQSEDFAYRLIRHLGITRKQEKATIPAVSKRKYGYINNQRTRIKQFSKVRYRTKKGYKVVIKARDSKGRFIKV